MAKVNEFNARGIHVKWDGLDEYIKDLELIREIPREVLLGMVNAKAEIVEKAEKESAKSMLQGKYTHEQDGVAQSVKRAKARINKKLGANAIIRFEGEQHGNRLGEIAFVNEYGKGKGGRYGGATNKKGKKISTWRGYQRARPFIMTAIEKSEGPGTVEAAAVLFDWQKKKGL